VYIGTYDKGVYAFRLDAKHELHALGLVGEVTNPSWVGTDRDHKYLYAVSELEGKENGGVASFSIDRETGKLHPLNHVDSAGVAPCFLAADATGKTLVVANYVTGGVSSFPIKPDGSLGQMSSLMTTEGHGPNQERQEGPHAHEAVISTDNQRVYVPDLGLDHIRIYRLDPSTSKLTPNDPPFVKGAPGQGPRHMVFDRHEKFAYLLNEIKPVISVYSRDPANGNLHLVESVPTLPSDFSKENTGAEIRLDPAGKFLYASNRGADTIQVFAVDSSTGKIKQVQSVPTGGKEPRGFALDPTGKLLLVGNQKSNSLVVFKVDGATGKLTSTGRQFEVPTPVDVLFVPAA
jgi:6-phosphogluconolactonase